ncbi:myeloid cell surface antigen CD33-like [Lissotriton helveticus]
MSKECEECSKNDDSEKPTPGFTRVGFTTDDISSVKGFAAVVVYTCVKRDYYSLCFGHRINDPEQGAHKCLSGSYRDRVIRYICSMQDPYKMHKLLRVVHGLSVENSFVHPNMLKIMIATVKEIRYANDPYAKLRSMPGTGVLGANNEYYKVNMTANVTAQEGLCVLIPCQFTIQETREAAASPSGYWFIDGKPENTAVASNNETKMIYKDALGRFKLVGDVTRRDCSLLINDVRRWDARTYYFRYQHSNSTNIKYSYKNYPLRITVVDRQEKPEISLPQQVMAGERITVQCTGPGRCSDMAPKITWGPGGQFKLNESNNDDTDGKQTYKSTFIFTASKEHNNKSLYCEAYFPAVNISNNISLNVEYMESTNLSLMPMIGGAVAGVVVLAGVCLLAWGMIYKVRRTRCNNEKDSDEKEIVGDVIPIYSVVKKTPKGPRTKNNPCSGANAMDSKEEDYYANFGNDNLHYASVQFSGAKPGSKPIPPPEETLYSEVKVDKPGSKPIPLPEETLYSEVKSH